MTDDLTTKIDKLWISALRGFNPNDIEFKEMDILRRQTTLHTEDDGTDVIIYTVTSDVDYPHSDNRDVHLEHFDLSGWTGGGYMTTSHGYKTKKYSSFRDGCLGNDAPKDPRELSFKEAHELYGGILGILKSYKERKKAYDLGVETVKKWPDFLKTN